MHVGYAMAHPKQRAHVAILAALIEAQRKAKSAAMLMQLQDDLINRMTAAQEDQQTAKRQKAKHAGKARADAVDVQMAGSYPASRASPAR
jgi:hypothetical protein